MARGEAEVWQINLLLVVLIIGNESPVSILLKEVGQACCIWFVGYNRDLLFIVTL